MERPLTPAGSPSGDTICAVDAASWRSCGYSFKDSRHTYGWIFDSLHTPVQKKKKIWIRIKTGAHKKITCHEDVNLAQQSSGGPETYHVTDGCGSLIMCFQFLHSQKLSLHHNTFQKSAQCCFRFLLFFPRTSFSTSDPISRTGQTVLVRRSFSSASLFRLINNRNTTEANSCTIWPSRLIFRLLQSSDSKKTPNSVGNKTTLQMATSCCQI